MKNYVFKLIQERSEWKGLGEERAPNEIAALEFFSKKIGRNFCICREQEPNTHVLEKRCFETRELLETIFLKIE